MAEIPEIGKISPAIFNELIFPRLGAKNEKVLVGPQHGVDVGIVEIGDKAISQLPACNRRNRGARMPDMSLVNNIVYLLKRTYSYQVI